MHADAELFELLIYFKMGQGAQGNADSSKPRELRALPALGSSLHNEEFARCVDKSGTGRRRLRLLVTIPTYHHAFLSPQFSLWLAVRRLWVRWDAGDAVPMLFQRQVLVVFASVHDFVALPWRPMQMPLPFCCRATQIHPASTISPDCTQALCQRLSALSQGCIRRSV